MGSGRVNYRAFTLSRQLERLVRREIMHEVGIMPEPHKPGYSPILAGSSMNTLLPAVLKKQVTSAK